MRPPALRGGTAATLVLVSWTVALAVFAVDRRLGPSQQRVTILWVADISQADRTAAEARLSLRDGEEVEPARWVYSLTDRSQRNIGRIVNFPAIVDTAHIDRERLRVAIDAPDVPLPLRRFLEGGLARPTSLFAALVGLVALWLGRRDLAPALIRAVAGPDGFPRHTRPVRPQAGPPLPRFLVSALLAVQDDWDWWAARAYYPIICALMALMVVFTGWHGRELAMTWDGWTIADWLITYSAGFVRRGLSGELVLAASTGLGMPANIAAWSLFVLAFTAFCTALAVLLRTRRVTFWFFVLCLSPAFLLFTFYNPDTVGRKDALLLASLTIWAAAATRSAPTLTCAATFAVAAFVLTLMHELFFFFSPYFVLVSYLRAGQSRQPDRWWLSALIPAGSACAVLLALTSSVSLGDPALCNRLLTTGAPPGVCEGVLSYGRESVADAAQDFFRGANGQAAMSLGAAAALTLLPPMIVLLISAGTAHTASLGTAGIVGAVIFSAPLFVLGLDWGRWLAIHATLATIACALLLPGRDMLPYRPPIAARSVVSLGTGLVVLVMMFGWSVKHCCQATLVVPFAPAQAMDRLWEEFEF